MPGPSTFLPPAPIKSPQHPRYLQIHHSVGNEELSHPKKRMDIKADYAQLPASPRLWPISGIPCPSHLKDSYYEQPWRRTGPLKTIAFHIYACIYVLFPWVSAAAAESLQSCPTLCDPIDGSPPGSPAPGILQARTHWSELPFPSPLGQCCSSLI